MRILFFSQIRVSERQMPKKNVGKGFHLDGEGCGRSGAHGHEDAEDGDDPEGVHELRPVLAAGRVSAQEVRAQLVREGGVRGGEPFGGTVPNRTQANLNLSLLFSLGATPHRFTAFAVVIHAVNAQNRLNSGFVKEGL